MYQDYSVRNTNSPDIKLNRFDLSSSYDVYKILPVSDAGRNDQRISFSNPVGFYHSGPYDPRHLISPPPAYLEITVSSPPPPTISTSRCSATTTPMATPLPSPPRCAPTWWAGTAFLAGPPIPSCASNSETANNSVTYR